MTDLRARAKGCARPVLAIGLGLLLAWGTLWLLWKVYGRP